MKMKSEIRRVTHIPAGAGSVWWSAGDTYTFKVIGNQTGQRFTLLEASIPPQAGPPPHIHRVEDEVYYILDGELDVLDHDRMIRVRAGDFVHIPPGTLHCFKNPRSTWSRMIIFFSPAGFENFLFEAAWPAQPGMQAPQSGPEELRRISALAPKYGMELRLPEAAEDGASQ